jgi:hypothetical protein
MGKTYWMLVTDQRNYEVTRKRGFAVQGVDSRNRRKAIRMVSDDRLIYYLADRRAFAATSTVTSGHFESHERIWQHHRSREDFPHRVNARPDLVLDEDLWLDARQIGPTLEYVKKWAPEDWPLAFIGMLHIIPQRDFTYLEDEMRRLLRKTGRPTIPKDVEQARAAPRGAARQPAAAAAVAGGQPAILSLSKDAPAPSAPEDQAGE